MTEDEISKIVIGAAIEVHKTLGGPGLLESVYEEALCWEVQQRGLKAAWQVALPILYKGQELATPLRLDLVIVECKALADYNSIAEVQLLTYLKLSDLKLGLVINFGEKLVQNGIKRVANGL